MKLINLIFWFLITITTISGQNAFVTLWKTGSAGESITITAHAPTVTRH